MRNGKSLASNNILCMLNEKQVITAVPSHANNEQTVD